jgi:hypothetical protein
MGTASMASLTSRTITTRKNQLANKSDEEKRRVDPTEGNKDADD